MPPDLPAKTPSLVEWINFQFTEITASASMLKDTCESIKKRKVDEVLSDLETKTVSTNKCATSVVSACHRVIGEHVQTLLNIDGEMRKEFAARFPSEAKKIKYTAISVPSFCTIRPPTPNTDFFSPPEKANSNFPKHVDVSDSELSPPTKLDQNISGRRTRRKLNLSSSQDMFGKVNEIPSPPLEVEESLRDGKKKHQKSTLQEESSNELGPDICSVENNDSRKNSKTVKTRKQSGKSTPKKNKGSADGFEGEKVGSPDKNKTMKGGKESRDDLLKKTIGKSVDNSGDTVSSVRTGWQLRERTKRESRARLAKKRSLRSQQIEPINWRNTSDEESDNEEIQKKKNDFGRKRRKVRSEKMPVTFVRTSDESENEKNNQKPDSVDVENESNMEIEMSESDVKVKLEHESNHSKQIEKTASASNAVIKDTVKDESSNSDDDEMPLSSFKKYEKTTTETKGAVLNESDSEASALNGGIDDNLNVAVMKSKSKPRPRGKSGISKTEANILLEKYHRGKFPTSIKVSLRRLDSLILEELEASSVIRLGQSVKGNDKDELNAALKSLGTFNPIVSVKKKRRRMPKSTRIVAHMKKESVTMSTDNDSDDTLELMPPREKNSVKPANKNSGNDIPNGPDEDTLEILSDKSSEGEGENVLDESDSAKTKPKSNKKGKSGSYKTQVVAEEIDGDSDDSDATIKKGTRNITLKSKSEGSSSEDFTRTKKVLPGRNTKRLESSGEESSGESKPSKLRKTRTKKKATPSSESSDEEYKAKPVKKVRRRIHVDSLILPRRALRR